MKRRNEPKNTISPRIMDLQLFLIEAYQVASVIRDGEDGLTGLIITQISAVNFLCRCHRKTLKLHDIWRPMPGTPEL